jgi:hypothetical protein
MLFLYVDVVSGLHGSIIVDFGAFRVHEDEGAHEVPTLCMLVRPSILATEIYSDHQSSLLALFSRLCVPSGVSVANHSVAVPVELPHHRKEAVPSYPHWRHHERICPRHALRALSYASVDERYRLFLNTR